MKKDAFRIGNDLLLLDKLFILENLISITSQNERNTYTMMLRKREPRLLFWLFEKFIDGQNWGKIILDIDFPCR